MKPKLFLLICSSISFGSKLILIFKASKTSPDPHFDETALFPCFATLIPILDSNKAEAVEMFKVFFDDEGRPKELNDKLEEGLGYFFRIRRSHYSQRIF